MSRKLNKEIGFSELENSFLKYKKKAGGIKYVACFGKTFLEKEHENYEIAKEVGEQLIRNGFGVIHGGYSGVMKAISEGAQKGIAKHNEMNHFANIGVPMKLFDQELERSSKINLPAAEDIVDRKKALTHFCDACVVLPSGGMGTILEALELFHINQLAEKFGGKIRPIIFMGKHWEEILDNMIKKIDMEKQKGGENFIYFIDSLEQLQPTLCEAIENNQ